MNEPEIIPKKSSTQLNTKLAKLGIDFHCVKALTRRHLIRSYRSLWSAIMAIITPLVVLVFFGPALNNITVIDSSPNQESLGYMVFLLPGIVAMALFYSAIYSSSEIIQSDKITHFQDILTLTPNSSKSLTIGYTLGGIVQSLVNVTIISAITLLFNPKSTSNLTLFYFLFEIIIAILGIASFVLLGILIAKKVQWQNFNILLSLLSLPLIYLSTIFAPLDSYGVLKFFVVLNPISLILDVFRYPATQISHWGVIVPGIQPIIGLLFDTCLLLIFLTVIFYFSIKLFEKIDQNTTKDSIITRIKSKIQKQKKKQENLLSTLAIDPIQANAVQTLLLQKLGREGLDKLYQDLLNGEIDQAKLIISQNVDEVDIQRIFEIKDGKEN